MRNLYLTSLFVMLATLAVGCGSNGSTPDASHPQEGIAPQGMSLNWTVELSKSGGIAGLQRQLTVESNGAWRASDRKLGRKNGRLTTEQLAKLNQTLSMLKSTPEPKSMRSFPSRCADCIETRINAVINGSHYTTTVLSGTKIEQPYADLLSQLSPLLQAAFSKQ